MTTARVILCLVTAPGAIGATIYLFWLWRDWKKTKHEDMLDLRYSKAWQSKMRQSIGLALILAGLFTISLTAILYPDGQVMRYLILLGIAAVGDWKVFKLFTDRFEADLQVSERRRR